MQDEDATIVLLNEAPGGVARNVIDLYQGLKQRNVKVKMVLSPKRLDERYMRELKTLDQADIFYVPMDRPPHFRDIKAASAIRSVLRNIEGPKVLHSHSTKAGLLGLLLRRNVKAMIFTPHAYRGIDPKLRGLARTFIEKVERFYSRTYDRVIAEVPAEFAYAQRLGISSTSLRLIPNGISIDEVPFQQIFERRSSSVRSFTLGFVGRLVYQKNPLLFIEVLRHVIQSGLEARAIILGDGPLKQPMIELAARYGLSDRMEWRGSVPAKAVYPEMDVMVHTSIYEGLPYALIEACAALLPIVATSNPGSEAILRDILPDSLSSDFEPASLAQLVISVLTKDHVRCRQMNVLKDIAERYSVQTMIDSYIQEYTQLAR